MAVEDHCADKRDIEPCRSLRAEHIELEKGHSDQHQASRIPGKAGQEDEGLHEEGGGRPVFELPNPTPVIYGKIIPSQIVRRRRIHVGRSDHGKGLDIHDENPQEGEPAEDVDGVDPFGTGDGAG